MTSDEREIASLTLGGQENAGSWDDSPYVWVVEFKRIEG